MLERVQFQSTDPWIIRQHAEHADPSKVDELAQGALGFRLSFGELALKYAVLREDHTQPGQEIPPEQVSYYVLEAEGTPRDIILLNGRPVHRAMGAPRHTTVSCADEMYAGRFAPRPDEHVVTITGSPYRPRIIGNIRDRVAASPAAGTQVYGAGPAEMPHIHDGIRRGELARAIYDAHKRQSAKL
jgi:hypothetical protein